MTTLTDIRKEYFRSFNSDADSFVTVRVDLPDEKYSVTGVNVDGLTIEVKLDPFRSVPAGFARYGFDYYLMEGSVLHLETAGLDKTGNQTLIFKGGFIIGERISREEMYRVDWGW